MVTGIAVHARQAKPKSMGRSNTKASVKGALLDLFAASRLPLSIRGWG